MLVYFLSIILAYTAVANGKQESKPPYPNLPQNYNEIQQGTACRTVDDHWKFTAIAYEPQYDENQQLTSHNNTVEVLVDENFQDSSSSRDRPIPIGWLAHDSITKVECEDGYYPENPSNVNHVNYSSQGYFYAKCSNGYMKTCHIDDNHQDSSLPKYYQQYSQNPTYQKCLTAQGDELLRCRRACDITHIYGNINYQLNVTPIEFQDFIGFDNNTAEEQYISYYYLPPNNNISINCTNNTFLSHSTSADDQLTQFSVTCHANGYVEYPGTNEKSSCVNTYGCLIPHDTKGIQWGLYQNGVWTGVNKIQHNDYVYVNCGNEEKFATCINGNLFPASQYVCND